MSGMRGRISANLAASIAKSACSTRTDRIFRAEAFEPTMAPLVRDGRFVVLNGAGHSDILADPRLIEAIAGFLGAGD